MLKSKNRFSIVIPLFNKKLHIKRAIDSVISQNHPFFELIVVNDGSTDGGEEIIKNISDARVKLINQENQGVSAARNRGIEESRTDYICLLDADDAWQQGFLLEISKLIDAYPNAVIYSVRHQKLSEDGKIFQPNVDLPDSFFGIIEKFPDKYRSGYGIINSSSACINKSLYELGHKFPVGEKKGEDIYYWLRASQIGDIAFSNKILSTIHLDSTNRSGSYGSTLPYHIKWYLSNRRNILQGKNGKMICKFILHNALVHVYGNVAINNLDLPRIIIKAFIESNNISAALFLPSLICPPGLMRLVRRSRRSQE